MLYQLSYARAPGEWWGKDSNLRSAKRGRFTVCSLWPLGHPTTPALRAPRSLHQSPVPQPPTAPLLTMHPAFHEARGVLDLRVECLPPDTALPSLLSDSARTRLVNPGDFGCQASLEMSPEFGH